MEFPLHGILRGETNVQAFFSKYRIQPEIIASISYIIFNIERVLIG